ncbi:hypothetical protein [Caulobacter sp. 17J65-9]|uniref:hypothetical protein n=1 Tax=Caulobacter sp. 17J65-9 TaxID=2709382 RepID=UPI0013CB2035|nr:hypothetical protein [Caulobacter sp. 17J65-9]NEX92625.1 hypothetical protein [Caulobacter sp. 17J65-9]
MRAAYRAGAWLGAGAAALALAGCAVVPFNPPDASLHADICAVLSQFEAKPGAPGHTDEAAWAARAQPIIQAQDWRSVPLNPGHGRPSGPWGRCLKARGPYQSMVDGLDFSPDRRFALLAGRTDMRAWNNVGACLLEKVDGRWTRVACTITLEEHVW